MTLDQLRIFIAVAEREHITRAAAALNLTQSAVSAAVAALEERHAVRLFDRVGRRIVLTDPGRLFLDEARSVLARAEQAERQQQGGQPEAGIGHLHHRRALNDSGAVVTARRAPLATGIRIASHWYTSGDTSGWIAL